MKLGIRFQNISWFALTHMNRGKRVSDFVKLGKFWSKIVFRTLFSFEWRMKLNLNSELTQLCFHSWLHVLLKKSPKNHRNLIDYKYLCSDQECCTPSGLSSWLAVACGDIYYISVFFLVVWMSWSSSNHFMQRVLHSIWQRVSTKCRSFYCSLRTL